MRKLGYKIKGINGLKQLRTNYAKLKYKPEWLWKIISDISQLFVYDEPEKAFQILCTKKLTK